MSQARPIGMQGAVGRADLLRMLAVAPRGRLTLDVDEAGWFGYEARPERGDGAAAIVEHGVANHPEAVAGDARALPLCMPFAFVVAEQSARAADSGEAPAEPDGQPPLDPTLPLAVPVVEPAVQDDLVPAARLMPALHRQLSSSRGGALDIGRLAQGLAAGRLPGRLPRRPVVRWNPDLVVVLDFCDRLLPYRTDMHRLARRLRRQCGDSALSLRVVNKGPLGRWSDWRLHQQRDREIEPPELAWAMPAAGTAVLIVSDLGLLEGGESDLARDWARFVGSIKRAGVCPVALSPLGAGQVDMRLSRLLPLLRWSPDAPPRPVGGLLHPRSAQEGLSDLLAMIAATSRIDPPLLRAMRQCNPVAPLDAGLEGAAWRLRAFPAPGVSGDSRASGRDDYLQRFRAFPARLQERLDALRRQHHAHLTAALRYEEALLWDAWAQPTATGTHAAMQRAAEARRYVIGLAQSLKRPGSGPVPGDWRLVAQSLLSRFDPAMRQRHRAALYDLVASLRDLAGNAKVPGWVDPAAMAQAIEEEQPVECRLVQDPALGRVRLQVEPPVGVQRQIGASLLIDGGGVRIDFRDRADPVWRPLDALPIDLAPLDAPADFDLETTTDLLQVATVMRPPGAIGWQAGQGGIAVASPPLAGHAMRWAGDGLRAVPAPAAVAPGAAAWTLVAETAPHPDAPGLLAFGIDAAFGIHADLTVATRHGSAVQRFRWIEPGSFLMGSPGDEAERHENEGPQHLVTLLRGFWLADTACSQALWHAVTGTDPSRFKGAARPVENVNWEDVQAFLRGLEGLVPGCGADLPTEAEWEYACRAGTSTAFSFGAAVDTDRVNYGGAKGADREETVAVKSLPPNPWGLYEMHGNVWQWCVDGHRTYSGAQQVDPRGPEDEGTRRAVRGGSWRDFAGMARSAARVFRPGDASDRLAFRLCLRSSEPGTGSDRLGGRRAPAPRDEGRAPNESTLGRLARIAGLVRKR